MKIYVVKKPDGTKNVRYSREFVITVIAIEYRQRVKFILFLAKQ